MSQANLKSLGFICVVGACVASLCIEGIALNFILTFDLWSWFFDDVFSNVLLFVLPPCPIPSPFSFVFWVSFTVVFFLSLASKNVILIFGFSFHHFQIFCFCAGCIALRSVWMSLGLKPCLGARHPKKDPVALMSNVWLVKCIIRYLLGNPAQWLAFASYVSSHAYLRCTCQRKHGLRCHLIHVHPIITSCF